MANCCLAAAAKLSELHRELLLRFGLPPAQLYLQDGGGEMRAKPR